MKVLNFNSIRNENEFKLRYTCVKNNKNYMKQTKPFGHGHVWRSFLSVCPVICPFIGGGASRIGLVPSRHFRCDHVCKLLLSVCLSTGMPPTGRLTTTRNTHSSAALRQHPLPVQGVAFATPAPAMSTAVDVPAAAPEGQPVVAASAAASNCGGEDCWLSDQSQDPGENQSSVIQPGHSRSWIQLCKNTTCTGEVKQHISSRSHYSALEAITK